MQPNRYMNYKAGYPGILEIPHRFYFGNKQLIISLLQAVLTLY
jgi:hypothetical protein